MDSVATRVSGGRLGRVEGIDAAMRNRSRNLGLFVTEGCQVASAVVLLLQCLARPGLARNNIVDHSSNCVTAPEAIELPLSLRVFLMPRTVLVVDDHRDTND